MSFKAFVWRLAEVTLKLREVLVLLKVETPLRLSPKSTQGLSLKQAVFSGGPLGLPAA